MCWTSWRRRPGGLTVTELAGRLGVNRTVVYRLVSTLEQHALVRKDARGRLHVGLGVLQLGERGPAGAARPRGARCCARSPSRSGCTAHLTVADGDEALALAVVEPSWTDFHVAYRVGARHPLDRGRRRQGDPAGARAATRAPYVATAGELQAGARGLAAPVRGVEGLEASVGIVTLDQVDPDERRRAGGDRGAARGRKTAQLSGDHARPGPGGHVAVVGRSRARRRTAGPGSTGAPQSRWANSTGEPSGSAR